MFLDPHLITHHSNIKSLLKINTDLDHKGEDETWTTNLKNWRPITLLGTIYKILGKSMTMSLQPLEPNS